MRDYLLKQKNLLGALISWAVFCLTCHIANVPTFEIAIFFVIFGILTLSWTSYVSAKLKLPVLIVCDILGVLAAIVTLGTDTSTAIMLAVSMQTVFTFIMWETQ